MHTDLAAHTADWVESLASSVCDGTHAPDHVRRQGFNLGLLFDDATVVSVELGVTIRANMVIPVTMAGPSFRLVRCISYG